MFLKNCWYEAAWDHEISNGLLARTILDHPVVLFRGQDCGIPYKRTPVTRNGFPVDAAYRIVVDP